jgi:hypothetical protein
VALLAAGSLLAVAPSAEAANLEAELGVGLFTGLEDGADLDAGWLGRVGLVAGLSDRSALELTATRIEAKDSATSDYRTAELFTAGFRYYTNSKTDARTRVFVAAGAGRGSGLGDGTTEVGYLGGGVRLRLGDSSGLTLKVPVLVDLGGGDTQTTFIPSLNVFLVF